jgi:hypothetical protein
VVAVSVGSAFDLRFTDSKVDVEGDKVLTILSADLSCEGLGEPSASDSAVCSGAPTAKNDDEGDVEDPKKLLVPLPKPLLLAPKPMVVTPKPLLDDEEDAELALS